MEYVGNLCSPCLLHEQPKGDYIFLSRLCTTQLHACLTALVLEESILLVTLVHVLSLTMNIRIRMTKVSKVNIHLSLEGCRQTFEGYICLCTNVNTNTVRELMGRTIITTPVIIIIVIHFLPVGHWKVYTEGTKPVRCVYPKPRANNRVG